MSDKIKTMKDIIKELKNAPGHHDQLEHGSWSQGQAGDSGVSMADRAGQTNTNGGQQTDKLKDLASRDVVARKQMWGGLPVAERDMLADAENSVLSRQDELLSGLQGWQDGDIDEAVKARIASSENDVTEESRGMVQDTIDEMTEMMSQQGVPPEKMVPLIKASTDALLAQEMEAENRQLGDHGIHHIKGNIDRAIAILGSVPNEKITGQQLAEIYVANVFHDAGYLTQPSRMFLDEGHPRWSQDSFDKNIKPMIKEIFDNHTAQEISYFIRSHDTTEINWKEDPVGSAIRVSDNTALFQEDKLPPLCRDVPDNIDTLFKLQQGELNLDQAKAEMHENNKNAGWPAQITARLDHAVDEVSPITPKFTLGMLGGTIDNIYWNDDHIGIALKENDNLTQWNKLMDLGQRQFGKFAEAYNIPADKFKNELNFKFNDNKGRTLLEGIIVKAKQAIKGLVRK